MDEGINYLNKCVKYTPPPEVTPAISSYRHICGTLTVRFFGAGIPWVT